MAKKALIADPDPDEARKQAAILTEAGYVVALHHEHDVIRAIEQSPPDVVVLRHERTGQSGLAIIGRLKRQGIASASAVVLTTSDLTPEAIRRHESQRFAADAYVRLPVSRNDLIEAAESVPEVLDAAAVAHEIPRPPPRPGKRGATPPTNRPISRLPGPASDTDTDIGLSDGDLKFVEDVFSNITTNVTDTGAMPSRPPPVDTSLSGPDRKVALLKQSLHQREEELARLKHVWKTRDEQISSAQEVYAAKGVEVAGLELRIEELTAELEQSQLELERRTEEFGRNIGEQYDSASLREAEMIQEVAKKEDELNRLRRTLRKTEDEKSENETTLKQHIFDWEKAYRAYEDHHRQVVLASLAEVNRLESAIANREGKTAAYAHRLREREEELARARQNLEASRKERDAARHARREDVERALWSADHLLLTERHRRRIAEDLAAHYEERTSALEEQAFRLDRLLAWRDRKATRQAAAIAQHARTLEAERDRLLDEVRGLTREHSALTAVLSEERAMGEASIARLLERESTTTRVDEARLNHRHTLILQLQDVRDAQANQIEVITRERDTSRGDVEQEKDRNRDLDESLAEVKVALAETKAALEAALEQSQRDLASTSAHLGEVETALAQNQAELTQERQLRAQERDDARLAVDNKDAEIKDRLMRIAELERDLQASREDVGAQRQTVSARDERIGELLAKIREVDALNVSLEGQNDRLRTQVAEAGAELEVLREQSTQKAATLHAREDELAALNSELDAARAEIKRQQTLVEERGRVASDFERDLAAEKTHSVALTEELAARGEEVATLKVNLEEREQQLGEARAEISAGATVLDEVQREMTRSRQQADDLRQQTAENDARLVAAEERAAANHDARLALDVALEEERVALDTARSELATQRKRADEAETRFTALDEAQHQLRKGATKVQKELVAMSEVKRRLEEKVAEMETRVDDAEKARLAALNERNQESAKAAEERERSVATESERARLEADVARNQEQVAQLTVALEQAQSEISDAAQNSSGDAAALEGERMARAALENDRNEARQTLAEMTARLQQSEQATAAATERVGEFESTAATALAEAEALRADLHAAQRRHDDNVKAMEQEAATATRAAQERDAIAHDRDAALQRVTALENEKAELRSAMNTLESASGAAAASEERSRKMAQELSAAKVAVDDERARRGAAESMIEDLKRSLNAQREDTQRLEQAIETQTRSLEQKTQTAQDAAKRLQAAETQVAQLQRATGTPADDHQVERLRSELAEAQQTAAVHAGEVSQLRQEKSALESQLATRPAPAPAAGASSAELEQWRQAAVASSEESALALERATSAETRLAHAQQQLARLSSAYDGARRQLEALGQTQT